MIDLVEAGTRERAIRAARRILERQGAEALTMRKVAGALRIKAPSLYKHFPGKHAIVAALRDEAWVGFGEALRDAARSAPGSVYAFTRAYRGWAQAHPHQYRLMFAEPDPEPDSTLREFDLVAVAVCVDVFGDAPRARLAAAALHGLVILELTGMVSPSGETERAWDQLVRTLLLLMEKVD